MEWAQEAVRIAELAKSNAKNPKEGEHKLIASFREVLEWAKADFPEMGGYREAGERVEEGSGKDEEVDAVSASGEAAKTEAAETKETTNGKR